MPAELRTALLAADAAAEISRAYYAGNFTVKTKADMTPVTQADVECEQKIREILLNEFPDHGFYGEETGESQVDAEFLWLVDPIDGTKAFIRQYPFFSTQIALMHRGELILGVSNGAELDELAWGERGKGAWLNGQMLQVSDIDALEGASLSICNLTTVAGSHFCKSLRDFVAIHVRFRVKGAVHPSHLLAAGKIDAVVESDVNILDIAALSVIVTEAGGVFTDMNGEAPGLETRSVLAANPALHAELLARLGGIVN